MTSPVPARRLPAPARTSRPRTRPARAPRSLRFTLAAAALISGLSACGNTPRPPSTAPASHMPASQLLGTAIANLKKATAIRMTGTVLASGTRTSFRVTIVPGTGCEGIIAIAGKGTARIVGLGSAVWTAPSRQLWAASGVPARLLPRLAGKFLSGTAAEGNGGDLSGMCQLTTLAVPPGTLTNHGTTTLDGTRMLLLTGPRASYWISGTATPELARASGDVPEPGAVNFAVQQTAPAITAPPAASVVSPAALAQDGL